jgi:preprotein translocase subunit YajC
MDNEIIKMIVMISVMVVFGSFLIFLEERKKKK